MLYPVLVACSDLVAGTMFVLLVQHRKNDSNASNINRIPHAGCHNSGWYALKLRQIFVFVSNRPDGVRNIMCGGLKGYSAGSFFVPIRWIMMIIISIHSCFSFDFGRFQIKLQGYY
jgi:hypothetical protein